MLMNFMIAKAKEIGVYIDMPNEEQVNEFFYGGCIQRTKATEGIRLK